VTQGSGGSFTLSWAGGYEFSAAMPQPRLSTTAGQTDLLGFIYNAAKGTRLFSAFVNGFDTSTSTAPSPSLIPGLSFRSSRERREGVTDQTGCVWSDWVRLREAVDF
jgi:hypothetical protein